MNEVATIKYMYLYIICSHTLFSKSNDHYLLVLFVPRVACAVSSSRFFVDCLIETLTKLY